MRFGKSRGIGSYDGMKRKLKMFPFVNFRQEDATEYPGDEDEFDGDPSEIGRCSRNFRDFNCLNEKWTEGHEHGRAK
jgi:hypothetical protein